MPPPLLYDTNDNGYDDIVTRFKTNESKYIDILNLSIPLISLREIRKNGDIFPPDPHSKAYKKFLFEFYNDAELKELKFLCYFKNNEVTGSISDEILLTLDLTNYQYDLESIY